MSEHDGIGCQATVGALPGWLKSNRYIIESDQPISAEQEAKLRDALAGVRIVPMPTLTVSALDARDVELAVKGICQSALDYLTGKPGAHA